MHSGSENTPAEQHPIFNLTRGDGPLIISIPHLGRDIPASLQAAYTPVAKTVADTDWHLDTLYAFAREMNATVLSARISRYVIDLNRPENDASLYPGKITTGLCPTESFRGEAVYVEGAIPDAAEKAQRVQTYWRPYHECLRLELQRLRTLHPNILLWEAHSIASVLPRLFEGKLPDLNLANADGASAADSIRLALEATAAKTTPERNLTWVMNGRFKGGYITRHYGAPEKGIHAVQLEMCQSTYMSEDPPFAYMPERADNVQPVLRDLVQAALDATLAL